MTNSSGSVPRETTGSRMDASRRLLESPGIQTMPCCFDALSAQLSE